MIQLDWGLFWYDDTPGRTLTEKITNAAMRYRIKYGTDATLCYVHPSVIDDVEQVNGIRVAGLRTILPNHLWLGVEIEKAARKAAFPVPDDQPGEQSQPDFSQL